MSPVFEFNRLVWLKQPDYPWWPGIVLDPASVEMEIPEGCDTCVLCLPSISSSIAFARGNNSEEIIGFNPNTDSALMEAGADNADCAVAIEEAIVIHKQQLEQQSLEENKNRGQEEENDGSNNNYNNNYNDDDDDDDAEEKEHGLRRRQDRVARRSAEEKIKREKRRNKKRDRDESVSRQQKQKRRKNRSGSSSSSSSEGAIKPHSYRNRDDDDDDDDENERKENNNKKDKNKKRKTMTDAMLMYEMESRHAPLQQLENDAAYLERLLQERRIPATDSFLISSRDRLEELNETYALQSSLSDDAEAALLDALSSLTMVNVTFAQLCKIKIGVSVGKFLSPRYPTRVVSLATAIQSFWFRQLPQEIQKQLSAQTKLDAASNDTTVGSDDNDGRGAALGPLGVQIENCFTDDEVGGTLRHPAPLARDIEAALIQLDDEDLSKSLLGALRSAENSELRCALLDGRVTAKELVDHATDISKLTQELKMREGGKSPAEPESPLAKGAAADNVTTLYACPNCGAREAVANEYSVQAHDNMSAIVRCLNCGETWNVEG